MDHRTRRSPARFLAPLALIIIAIAVFTVVSNARDSGKEDSGVQSTENATTKQAGRTTKARAKSPKRPAKKPRTYTVQPGDTLGAISEKTGVPLTTIQDLNPQVDSNALTTGQKIKLTE